jgi:acyl carrier protein
MLNRTSTRVAQFLKNSKFNFGAVTPAETKTGVNIQPWIEKQNNLTLQASQLVLADESKIEEYVLSAIKGYFRTTYKDGLTLESNLADHGLDSLDAVEISMTLEDELGYIIEAEIMPKFTKPKHYVNYIKHMEAYKREFHFLPQLKAKMSEENLNEWIPGGETLKKKLYSFVKSDGKKKEKPAKH